MLRRLGACALAGAIGMAVAATGAFASETTTACPRSARSPGARQPESEAAAQADAASLLAELSLPAGSSESSTEPAEEDSLLRSPGYGPPDTPNAVDEHEWWLVALTPAETLAYICEHLPAGTGTELSGALGGPNVPENETEGLTVPGQPGTLVVWAVRLPNGSTALRADAQVVWITPRPASDTFPAGARLVQIAVHGYTHYAPRALALLLRLPARITSVAQIEKLTAALNGLEVAQPGIRLCPAGFGNSVLLAFFAAPGASPLAEADVATTGCGGVSVTIDGTSQPPLEGGWDVVEQIARALGVSATAGLPIGGKPRISGAQMSPATFSDEREGTVTIGAQLGSELRFGLSAPAQVRIAIRRVTSGSRHNQACGAADTVSGLAHASRCQRGAGKSTTMRLEEPAGRQRIPLAGRDGTSQLQPGRYVAVLTASNTGGRSKAVRTEFEVRGPE